MFAHFDEDIQIPRRPAAQTGLAFAGKADARPGFHPGRDVHRQRSFLLHPARAAAGTAGVLHDLAHAVAGRAGPLHGEKALLRAHLAHARTGGAGHRLGAAFGAGAPAGVAGDRGRHVDRLLDALKGFLKRDAQVVAQVGSALRARPPAAAPAATHEIAEEILEHVRKGAGEIAIATTAKALRPAPAAATAHATLKGSMAEPVIGGLAIGILQHVIGFVHFLELRLGIRIVRIPVRVQFLGLLPIGLFQLVRRCATRHAKDVIVISFCHSGQNPLSEPGGGGPFPNRPLFRFTRCHFRLFSPRSSKSASTMSSSTGRGPSSSPPSDSDWLAL